eukprot:4093530-Alexandrium_andersonii.AAC.1
MAEGGSPVEPESSIGMGDATVEDIADFRAVEPPASAVSEWSGDCRSGSGGQPYRGDIAGAVLDSELVVAARAGETRLMESWHMWG